VEAFAVETVVPLVDYLAAVAAARYDDYARKPDARVRDEQTFEEMRQFVLDRYAGTDAARSVRIGDADFDCLLRHGGTAVSAGHSPGRAGCPDGTVPVRRVTLAELVRFETVAGYLGRSPGRGGSPPTGR
jgi:hypothetical protein